jgi:hypothetical protein
VTGGGGITVLDYIAYIWAQEATADEAGLDIRRAGFAEAVAEDRWPGPLRRLGARFLRRLADHLDAGLSAGPGHR